jgi:tetratricopeptide (TPR) repeat protein
MFGKKTPMKKIVVLGLVLSIANLAHGQKRDYLFGLVTRDSLMKPNHVGWFTRGYENYQPDNAILEKLKKLPLKEYTFEIFFGSWCGDSRRDVPRFIKITDMLGVPAAHVKLIAVGLDDQYKQAPGGETNNRGIYRVATFVVSKQGKEINRITEHAVHTLEHDLLDILTMNSYVSNYRAYPQINTWLQQGSLRQDNISTRGYAKQIGLQIFTPGELNACAHVLLVQGKIKESVAVYRMNAFLFSDNVDVYDGLAGALSKNGNHEEAIETIEYAITMNDGKNYIKSLLETYYTIKKEAELKR